MTRALAGLVAAIVLLAAAVATGPEPLTPPVYRRSAEQTFLTYPEWFLVHSPAEYAEFIREHRPSEFPWMGHVAQFWSAYAAVARATAGDRFNFGYHVMIVVIGVSTTVEYALRAVYETLVGRVTERLMPPDGTDEDRYARRVAQDYVNFIRMRPWYEYDFLGKLVGLWRETSFFGPGFVRKWERKYLLTTEYGLKGVYAWFIALATSAGYEAERNDTAIVLDHLPASTADLHIIEVVSSKEDGPAIVTVPRYAAFGIAAIALARVGVDFVEIAGNRGDIVMSVIAPAYWDDPPAGTRVLLEQPVLTRPGYKRVALVMQVSELAHVLRTCQVQIEHVYDY
ncbi:MAG: hypothetical protein GC151_12150 [Betaproteobacteria bacterium]|nr:hypothetical protein [Betaproteobacteria bacterium]